MGGYPVLVGDRLSLTLLLLAAAALPSAGQSSAELAELRVMSFNVRVGGGQDEAYRVAQERPPP